MTPKQQRTHGVLWLVLGPLLALGLALAVLARQPIAVEPAPTDAAAEAVKP